MSARNEGSVDPHHSAPLATSLIRCPAPRCRQGTQIRPTRSKPAKGRRTRRVQLCSHTFWQVDQVRDNIPQQHPCLPSSAPSTGRKNLAYVKGRPANLDYTQQGWYVFHSLVPSLECQLTYLPLIVCASKYHQLEVSNNARVTPSCGNTFAAGGCLARRREVRTAVMLLH